VRVAAYQTSLAASKSGDVLPLMREQVIRCEAIGVEILCCPEAVLGGLADYSDDPTSFAIAAGERLTEVLDPLTSRTVTTIVGFTEVDTHGRLYNAAAVFQGGAVVGLYRKLHPAINRSVYGAGREMPVFTVGALTFGILICRDSTFPEPARVMAEQGAAALFVPTNNGLAPGKAGPEIVADARRCDIARARENGVSVIRADVVGRDGDLTSFGSSSIVDQDGEVLASAALLETDLIVAEIETARRSPTPGSRD